MMARRSNKREGRLASCNYMFCRLNGGASSQPGNVVRVGGNECVGVEHGRASSKSGDPFQVRNIVDGCQLI
jgi:hypothetical protein